MASKSRDQATTRQFIRHPSGMPIQFTPSGDMPPQRERLRNVSEGGLCFCAHIELEPGYLVRLCIPVIDQVFETEGLVMWCRQGEGGFDVGVRFVDADAMFRVRMVEQLCHIEQYRREVARDEGRHLSSEEAAAEWIDRYASDFPSMC